jgi:hypothetical protein
MPSQDVVARFADKVRFPADGHDDEDCWVWVGAKHSRTRGYGKFRYNGVVMNAHKVSYLLFNGDVQEGQVIGHVCNNEQCVNPHHLIAQSQSDNIRYAVICGRHNSCKSS